ELLNQYCSKGSKIGVTGSLKVDKFQDKEGNNREITKVNANRIEFLDSKGSNQGAQSQNNSQGQTDQQPKNDSYTQAFGGQTNGQAQPQQQKPAYEDNPFKEDGPADVQDDELPF
ncbi:single-stranded DNA-binding protein, partial [Salinicoccus albus]|uniref:single-stranded DNA-binding protein n=1 Tax=Salinicoccus albus TaxID=418756 RepID=UPI00035F969A